MQAHDLLALRSGDADHGLIFLHSGFVTEAMLEDITRTLQQRLESDGIERKRARNIFAIFVEQIQNIVRYSSETAADAADGDRADLRLGIIAVGREGEDYFVACANVVPKSEVARLSARLHQVRGAGPDGLKTMYKETLRRPPEATSKGAGVGLIDMARRSEQPIHYEFLDLDEERAWYFLKVFA